MIEHVFMRQCIERGKNGKLYALRKGRRTGEKITGFVFQFSLSLTAKKEDEKRNARQGRDKESCSKSIHPRKMIRGKRGGMRLLGELQGISSAKAQVQTPDF